MVDYPDSILNSDLGVTSKQRKKGHPEFGMAFRFAA
jgi:hypothetical protein